MKSLLNAAVLAGCAAIALSARAPAQNASPPAQLHDTEQLPVEQGQVQQFTLTPRGDIDGLILTDGTEVKIPPHLSTEIAYSIKPGDTVTIHGLRAAAVPLVQAVSISDEATGRTVIDDGPPPPRGGPALGPAAPGLTSTEVQGRVHMALHGPRGEVNGALLEDGTVLRLPPPEAERFAALLQPRPDGDGRGKRVCERVGKGVRRKPDRSLTGPIERRRAAARAGPRPSPASVAVSSAPAIRQ
jgi:hypothetical protein